MTKYSMHQLLSAVLFLLYCTCGCFAAAVVQQLPQKGQSALQTYTVSTPPTSTPTPTPKEAPDPKNGPEWQPIRIAVYTKYVDVAVKYCQQKKNLEKVEEMDEEMEVEAIIKSWIDVLCNDPDTRMTEEKKDTLLNKLLPEAIKLHTDRLKVKPVKDKNLLIEENKLDGGPKKCGFMIPSRHRTQGIPNADFVIYVALSKKYKEVVICSQDKDNRPTSAIISFIPNEINATRHFIRLAARHIAKGLGFRFNLMNTLKMIQTRASDLRPKASGGKAPTNGIKFYMMTSSKIVEMLEKHYGCQGGKVKGLYLENEVEKDKSPYWERRIAKDELMSTYVGEPTGMYYSVLTLAAFHDMPFYSAVFEMAEPMSWGNKSGCEFLKLGEKASAETKYSNMFCKEGEKKILQCTSDRFSLGMCSVKNKGKDKLPGEYQYFTKDNGKPINDLMDGYTIIRPLKHTSCEDGDETLMPGSLIGPESRCLKADNLKLKGSSKSSITIAGVCAKVKCGNDNKVRVQLKGYEGEDKWLECKGGGEKIEVKGTVLTGGSIVCPNYKEVCTGLPETERPTITFDHGTEDNDLYDNLFTADKLKEEEEKEPDHQISDRTAVNSPATDTQHATDDTSHVNNTADVSNGSNGQQSGEENTRESASADAASSLTNPKNAEGQMKEDSNPPRVLVVLSSDSSTVTSYMAPLALLVCAVGFVMIP